MVIPPTPPIPPDYSQAATKAARQVMLEVTRVLAEYKDSLVIIGGWVPELLQMAAGAKHIGSNDVDLALDHRKLSEAGYRTIGEHLLSRGYARHADRPFTFVREVCVGGRTICVNVDFLCDENAGVFRLAADAGLQPQRAKGCDLALGDNEKVRLDGTLPGGAKDSADVRVAGVVPFIVMKSFALAGRMKEKDAWDINFVLAYYPGGIRRIAELFRQYAGDETVARALAILDEKFASPEHTGPVWVADFDEITDAEAREIAARGAYERVNLLLEELKIRTAPPPLRSGETRPL